MHSEGSDSGISAEVSLLEGEYSHDIGPNPQPLATAHAVFSPNTAAGSQSVNRSSNEAASQSREMLRQASGCDGGHPANLHDAALEAAGQLAAVEEGSTAALVRQDSTATASGHVGNAISETQHPLELLAALRSSQSLLASAVGSASEPLSLAAPARDSAPACQLPQALHVGSSASGPRQFRPGSAARAVSRSHSVGDLAAPHAQTDAGPVPVDTADTVQSSPAAETCLPDEDLSRQPEDKIAASEPMLGSSQYATVSGSSRGASPLTRDPVEGARTTVSAHSSVADLFAAASLPVVAGGDGTPSDVGNKPATTATADDVLTPTSSIAASTQSEHRQAARDGPPSGGPLRYSMSSDNRAAGVGVALSARNSTAQKAAHTATTGNHTEDLRSSSGGEVTQALEVSDPVEESSRSSTNEATGTDQPERCPSLSRTGSAGKVPISSHAEPERSVSPTLPAEGGSTLGGDPKSVNNGQTVVSVDSDRATCLVGTSLAAPADHAERSPAASPMASSMKSIDSTGTSLQQSGGRAATPVNTSLSQLGKDGGAGVIRHSVILTGLDPLDQWLYRHPSVLASLDYEKVKADLQVRHLS